MGRTNQGHFGSCTSCGTISSSVSKYGTRKLKHYTIGGESAKTIPFIVFRCANSDCRVKTFRYYADSDKSDLCGKSIYTKSSKAYVIKKMSAHAVAYNSFQHQIEDDFNVKTSLSTLYTWFSTSKTSPSTQDLSDISVLNTDEKHPYKKKIVRIKNSLS